MPARNKIVLVGAIPPCSPVPLPNLIIVFMPNKSNLTSPQQIASPCDLADIEGWIKSELKVIKNKHERKLVSIVIGNLDDFVKFPKKAVLMWEGCDRVAPKGKMKYHKFPAELVVALKKAGLKAIDGRPNGPAIAAFLFGGGERPQRYGSNGQVSVCGQGFYAACR